MKSGSRNGSLPPNAIKYEQFLKQQSHENFSFLLGSLLTPNLPDNGIVGTWRYDREDGSHFLVEFKANNTYEVDMDRDGAPDLKGKCKIEGDTMNIEDTTGDCMGKVGVYTMQMEGETLTFTEVSDDCPNRGAGALSKCLSNRSYKSSIFMPKARHSARLWA